MDQKTDQARPSREPSIFVLYSIWELAIQRSSMRQTREKFLQILSLSSLIASIFVPSTRIEPSGAVKFKQTPSTSMAAPLAGNICRQRLTLVLSYCSVQFDPPKVRWRQQSAKIDFPSPLCKKASQHEGSNKTP